MLTYGEAMALIREWRSLQGSSMLFGNEKDRSFESSVESIYQTFDGIELYPSIEEKASHLLYFIVKNHSFSDGNKRIAAGLFVYFLDRNGRLFRADGSKRIGDNALVAITLLVAESKPEEKDTMIKLIVNLINHRN
jgi:prophage maintenance system killer protein